MITFFDWRTLRKHNAIEILNILRFPEKLKGIRDSYIKNLYNLIDNPLNATDTELYVYLDLASRRNYYDYKYLGKGILKVSHIDDYDIDKLYMNTILDIKNNEIYFKYEE